MDSDLFSRFPFHVSGGARGFCNRFCSFFFKLLDAVLEVQDYFLKLQDLFFHGKIGGISRKGWNDQGRKEGYDQQSV